MEGVGSGRTAKNGSLLDSERKVREMDAEIKRYKNQIVKIKNDYKAMLAGFAERRREAGQVKRKKGMESNILNQRAISEQSSNMNSENVVYISSSDSETDDTDTTLPVAERVETIAASDSPYLPVKSKFGSILDMKYHTSSSSSGISTRHLATTSSAVERSETITDSESPDLPVKSNFGSFLDTKYQAPSTSSSISTSDLATVSSTSALFKSYQKLAMAKHPTCTKSFDEAYDGLGGSKKEDVYPSPKRAQSGMKRAKGTCSSAKFRKLAPL